MTKKFNRKILNSYYARLGATINKFSLIQENDNILVGISGGKDSLSLLAALSTRRNFSSVKYSLKACFINVLNLEYNVDKEYLKEFCKSLDIELIIQDIDIDFSYNNDKDICFWCSWNKRKAMFELAKEQNFNKLALGHHLDDAVETLLINMFCHSSISSMPAKLSLFDGKLELIRPLIEFTNQEMADISMALEIKSVKNQCIYENKTFRKKASDLINHIEKEFNTSRKSIYNSMDKICIDYLPSGYKKDND